MKAAYSGVAEVALERLHLLKCVTSDYDTLVCHFHLFLCNISW